MPRTYKKKLGTPQGVSQWKNLETAGDVRRFLAWCVHSVRGQSLDTRAAGVLGQLGVYLLKALTHEREDALRTEIERLLDYTASRYPAQYAAVGTAVLAYLHAAPDGLQDQDLTALTEKCQRTQLSLSTRQIDHSPEALKYIREEVYGILDGEPLDKDRERR